MDDDEARRQRHGTMMAAVCGWHQPGWGGLSALGILTTDFLALHPIQEWIRALGPSAQTADSHIAHVKFSSIRLPIDCIFHRIGANRRDTNMKEQFYEELASKSDWDAVTNHFETHRRLTLIFDCLLAKTDLRGLRTLDAGSGGGHFSAEAVKRGAKVTSLDVGPNLLKQVSQRCQSECVVGSVLDIPFPDGTFDLVFSTEVIEHTPDPLRAVRELCRVVAPGGTLVITTPCKLWQPVVRLATTLKIRPYNGYENFLWPSQLRDEVAGHGCNIFWHEGFNFMPIFWRPLAALFDLFDAIMGKSVPFVMVNVGVMARKT